MTAHAVDAPLTVGIVYPTELTEDLGLVALYRRWLEERGCDAIIAQGYEAGGHRGVFDPDAASATMFGMMKSAMHAADA